MMLSEIDEVIADRGRARVARQVEGHVALTGLLAELNARLHSVRTAVAGARPYGTAQTLAWTMRSAAVERLRGACSTRRRYEDPAATLDDGESSTTLEDRCDGGECDGHRCITTEGIERRFATTFGLSRLFRLRDPENRRVSMA